MTSQENMLFGAGRGVVACFTKRLHYTPVISCTLAFAHTYFKVSHKPYFSSADTTPVPFSNGNRSGTGYETCTGQQPANCQEHLVSDFKTIRSFQRIV